MTDKIVKMYFRHYVKHFIPLLCHKSISRGDKYYNLNSLIFFKRLNIDFSQS